MDWYGVQDYNTHQLQNIRLQIGSSHPAAPVEGQIYYNSTAQSCYVYNGTTWQRLGGNFTNTSARNGLALAYASTTTFTVSSGSIEIDNIYGQKDTTTTVNVTTPANFIEGAIADNTWIYVYAQISGSSYAIKLSTSKPQYSSTLSTTDGTLLYRNVGGTWLRHVGSIFYVNPTLGIRKFANYNNLTVWDSYVNAFSVGSISSSTSTVSLSDGVPETSNLVLVKLSCNGATRGIQLFPLNYPLNGTTGDVRTATMQGPASTAAWQSAFLDVASYGRQLGIRSNTATPTGQVTVDVVGYYEEL